MPRNCPLAKQTSQQVTQRGPCRLFCEVFIESPDGTNKAPRTTPEIIETLFLWALSKEGLTSITLARSTINSDLESYTR